MGKEKEKVWTSDMGFMPPIPKIEGRTICRQECQLTEYKEEIERLREALRMWVKFWEEEGDDVWVAEEAMEATRGLLRDDNV
jgi:hypothetical protein